MEEVDVGIEEVNIGTEEVDSVRSVFMGCVIKKYRRGSPDVLGGRVVGSVIDAG